ncbi:bacteriocin immunity protein [Enterobacter pasteurii]|uniref:bacteriocin immunity protein n=1 Tax=Enterobacter pasteurii TaxID=3029761 RepID=UPI00398986AD
MEFVRKFFNVADTSESEDIKNILEFKRLTEHPDGSDLIFYPEMTVKIVLKGEEVKEWCKANGKPGFREV